MRSPDLQTTLPGRTRRRKLFDGRLIECVMYNLISTEQQDRLRSLNLANKNGIKMVLFIWWQNNRAQSLSHPPKQSRVTACGSACQGFGYRNDVHHHLVSKLLEATSRSTDSTGLPINTSAATGSSRYQLYSPALNQAVPSAVRPQKQRTRSPPPRTPFHPWDSIPPSLPVTAGSAWGLCGRG